MEITAHSGARPDHAKWQGQLVSLSGRNAGRVIEGNHFYGFLIRERTACNLHICLITGIYIRCLRSDCGCHSQIFHVPERFSVTSLKGKKILNIMAKSILSMKYRRSSGVMSVKSERQSVNRQHSGPLFRRLTTLN